MTIKDYFQQYVWLNPATGKREWLPNVPDYIKVAARGYKAERLKNANRSDQPAAPGADQSV